jgi:tRNA pseudouridine55 synthase
VYWVHLRRYAWPEVEFEVACGRGTYIRALIRDIGVALGTGGCLTALARTAIGSFVQSQSCTLEALAQEQDLAARVLPVHEAKALLERPIEIPPRPAAD